MFESKHEDAEIKVIDFGLSAKFQPGEKLTEGVGTIYTMAPQVLQGVYSSQADLWSIGVITYILLSGQKPFYHKRRRRVIDKIMRCDYNFDGKIWRTVSDEAIDFVSSLIEINPKMRLTATEALKHKWLSKEFPLSDRKPSSQLMSNVQNNMFTFGNSSELKKLALMVSVSRSLFYFVSAVYFCISHTRDIPRDAQLIAHKSSNEEIMQLRKVFDQYDKDNDGTISKDEFREVRFSPPRMARENILAVDKQNLTVFFFGPKYVHDTRLYKSLTTPKRNWTKLLKSWMLTTTGSLCTRNLLLLLSKCRGTLKRRESLMPLIEWIVMIPDT